MDSRLLVGKGSRVLVARKAYLAPVATRRGTVTGVGLGILIIHLDGKSEEFSIFVNRKNLKPLLPLEDFREVHPGKTVEVLGHL